MERKQLIKIAEINACSEKSMNELMDVFSKAGYTVIVEEDYEDYFLICKELKIEQEN